MFFEEPPAFLILVADAEMGASPPLLLFEGAFPPEVDVGVAACDGVVCADEGPGESC